MQNEHTDQSGQNRNTQIFQSGKNRKTKVKTLSHKNRKEEEKQRMARVAGNGKETKEGLLRTCYIKKHNISKHVKKFITAYIRSSCNIIRTL